MSLMAPTVLAQKDSAGWPVKPVRVIVPFPPGGSVDSVARLLVPQLSESFGQQFLVENRGGASGNIGTAEVAHAAADGYTLLLNTIPLVANGYVYSRMPFDPLTDFVTVSLISVGMNMLVVHPSVPAHSVTEFIALAKARPGTLNYATAGAATNPHIAAELFNYMAGINTVAIHFKGSGPGLLATLAGDTQFTFAGASEAWAQAASGKLRSLGVTGPKRSPAFPDIPTVADSGLPGYEFVTWHGLLAPRGTPAPVIKLLSEHIRQVLANPEAARLFRQGGNEIVASTPEEFAAFLKAESVKWGRVIRERGIKAD
jgi:tripartite-type tricarboxylate transporter receptor subunit TctC